MDYLVYLRTIASEGDDTNLSGLKAMLMSQEIQVGNPYDEGVSFLLKKYERRIMNFSNFADEVLGLKDLVRRLSLVSYGERATALPLKNELMSGECVIVNNEFVGYAFVKRGRSVSKQGLWVDGKKID